MGEVTDKCDVQGPYKTSQQSAARATRWRCNRSVGHPAPHRNYDRRTFGVRAEWDEDEVYTPAKRTWRKPKVKEAPVIEQDGATLF